MQLYTTFSLAKSRVIEYDFCIVAIRISNKAGSEFRYRPFSFPHFHNHMIRFLRGSLRLFIWRSGYSRVADVSS